MTCKGFTGYNSVNFFEEISDARKAFENFLGDIRRNGELDAVWTDEGGRCIGGAL